VHLVGIKEVNEGNEITVVGQYEHPKESICCYQEKSRRMREALRPAKKSHLNHHDPFLGCGGKDKKRHV
jgi:hypothetical protein